MAIDPTELLSMNPSEYSKAILEDSLEQPTTEGSSPSLLATDETDEVFADRALLDRDIWTPEETDLLESVLVGDSIDPLVLQELREDLDSGKRRLPKREEQQARLQEREEELDPEELAEKYADAPSSLAPFSISPPPLETNKIDTSGWWKK